MKRTAASTPLATPRAPTSRAIRRVVSPNPATDVEHPASLAWRVEAQRFLAMRGKTRR
jgi:hypothetical protein